MKRGIIFGAVGFGIAYLIGSQLASAQKDLEHYDRLRAMSGEPPFLKEQLSRVMGIVMSFVGDQTSSHGVLGSIPHDIVRYARISTM
jgi:hypothetical protein